MSVLGVTHSILGQPWRWRSLSADARDGALGSDGLLVQLLLSRGCPPDAIDAHRTPSIRHFMPDPSIFRDMDRAAARLADAVQAGEQVAIFGDYDVDGATSTGGGIAAPVPDGPADFGALDALLDATGAGATGPVGYVISQLLGHTS